MDCKGKEGTKNLEKWLRDLGCEEVLFTNKSDWL